MPTLEVFVPDGENSRSRRLNEEGPVEWSEKHPSRWLYRLRMFESESNGVTLSGARIRRLGPSDLEAMRSSETPVQKGGLLVSLYAQTRWDDVTIEKWPWVIDVPVEPKSYESASIMAESVHNAVQSALRIAGERWFFTLRPTVYQLGIAGSLMGEFGLLPRELDFELPQYAEHRLTDEAIDTLAKVWDGQLKMDDPRVALAVRRFNSAYERPEPDDALIDLWIGLEALFSGTGTDITYKAAMRIAYYLGDSPEARKTLFKVSKDSYNARSRLVHGDPPDALKEANEVALESLRRALVRIMSDGTAPDPLELDDVIAAGTGAEETDATPP